MYTNPNPNLTHNVGLVSTDGRADGRMDIDQSQ